jgi:hypothetical protein
MLTFWAVLSLIVLGMHYYDWRTRGDLELALILVIDPCVLTFGLAITSVWGGWIQPWWGFPTLLILGFLFLLFGGKRGLLIYASYYSFTGAVTFVFYMLVKAVLVRI